MILVEAVDVQLEWSDLQRLTYHVGAREVRSTGLHVSDVLRHLAVQGNRYTDEDHEDDMPLRVLLGLAFEEAAARLYEGMNWQPGQLECDGVVGSPDGLTWLGSIGKFELGNPDFVIEEFKYTGKSQRVKGGGPGDLKDIRTEWTWMQQGMSYINLYRRVYKNLYRGINRCRFHICWKYGNYVKPFTEKYVRYLVEFSEAELAGNWAMLQAFKNEI